MTMMAPWKFTSWQQQEGCMECSFLKCSIGALMRSSGTSLFIGVSPPSVVAGQNVHTIQTQVCPHKWAYLEVRSCRVEIGHTIDREGSQVVDWLLYLYVTAE